MALLEIKKLNCFYGDVQIIYDVSLHINEGEVISLIGGNGAGKSTMIRTVSGLMKPRSGEILFEGQPIHTLRPEKIVERGIIQVPEGRKLFSLMTVRENLDVGAHNPRAYPHLAATLKEVYKLLPRLEEREKQQAITLSGGEQQMVAIGRGIMALPKILMMDGSCPGSDQGDLHHHQKDRRPGDHGSPGGAGCPAFLEPLGPRVCAGARPHCHGRHRQGTPG
jgi:branched-chain amino acid transport system ATP-binding protein